MVKCKKCGAIVQRNFNFCDNCMNQYSQATFKGWSLPLIPHLVLKLLRFILKPFLKKKKINFKIYLDQIVYEKCFYCKNINDFKLNIDWIKKNNKRIEKKYNKNFNFWDRKRIKVVSPLGSVPVIKGIPDYSGFKLNEKSVLIFGLYDENQSPTNILMRSICWKCLEKFDDLEQLSIIFGDLKKEAADERFSDSGFKL